MLGLFCCDNVIISPDASRQRALFVVKLTCITSMTVVVQGLDSIINDVSAISNISASSLAS